MDPTRPRRRSHAGGGARTHCYFDATGAAAPSRLVPASDSEDLVDLCLLDQAPAATLVVVGRTPVEGVTRFLDAPCAIAVLERAATTVAVVPEPSPEVPVQAGPSTCRVGDPRL